MKGSKPSTPLGGVTPLARARANRAARVRDLRARDRLGHALDSYDALLAVARPGDARPAEVACLAHLTDVFRGSYARVKEQIAASGKQGIQVINAVKRSAGTNYQGLVEYAVHRWLDTTDLAINLGPNAPRGMRDELTIHGIDDGEPFSVEPDIDICLWEEQGTPTSPLVFVSAKTSLVDRAGQAARWKLYLDLHQTTCPHTKVVTDCPIHRTRVKVKTTHPIVHCIVTANIYKIETTQPEGELRSGQCRNNTYMFRNRYTTRHDSAEHRPAGWTGFDAFPALVLRTFIAAPANPGR